MDLDYHDRQFLRGISGGLAVPGRGRKVERCRRLAAGGLVTITEGRGNYLLWEITTDPCAPGPTAEDPEKL